MDAMRVSQRLWPLLSLAALPSQRYSNGAAVLEERRCLNGMFILQHESLGLTSTIRTGQKAIHTISGYQMNEHGVCLGAARRGATVPR